jgi:uncharacterized protein (PEP-CTERM system associated)
MSSHERFRRRSAGIVAAATVMAYMPSYAAEFGAQLGLSANYIDNVLQVPQDAQKVDDVATVISPVLTFAQENNRATTSVKYDLQAVYFADRSDLNETSQQLDANSDIRVVTDFLNLALRANMWQQLVDPAQQLNYENLFSTRNLLDGTSGSAEPLFNHVFGPVRVQARYRYGFVQYSGGQDTLVAEDNARDQDARFEIGSPDLAARFTWDAKYTSERSKYDISAPYSYDLAALGVELQIASGLRLLAAGGSETDVSVNPSAGGLDSGFWRAGFRWEPDRNNLVEATLGERFFGNSYSARIEHRAKYVDLRLSYSEEPTTEARRQITQFADAPNGAASSDVPNIPEVTRLTTDAYLNKAGDAELKLSLRRTTLDVRAFSFKREYLALGQTEDGHGGSLTLRRNLSARSILELLAWAEKVNLLDGNDSDDLLLRLGLYHQFSRALRGRLEYVYIDEKGVNGYIANIATLGFLWTFR